MNSNPATIETIGDCKAAVRTINTQSGLSVAWLVTTLDVSTTAAVIPGGNLAQRKHMVIKNLSTTDKVYIGPTSGVTADAVNGTTSGWEIDPEDQFHVDISADVDIYAIVASGTVKIKVAEYS